MRFFFQILLPICAAFAVLVLTASEASAAPAREAFSASIVPTAETVLTTPTALTAKRTAFQTTGPSAPNAFRARSKYIDSKSVESSRDCILQLILNKMERPLNADLIKPKIRTQTSTTLKEFQDSMEPFWHFRPDVFTNAFQPFKNEIFIMTERAYYEKHGRSVYDSMAHELTHYIQFAYQGADFTVADDSLELHAIDVQTWFRETYKNQFQKDQFKCPIKQENLK